MRNRKEYYQHYRDTHKEQFKAYRDSRKDIIKVSNEKYRTANKEQIRKQNKEYRNTFHCRYMEWKKNAKNRGRQFLLDEQYLAALPLTCSYSGVPLTYEANKFETISIDRVDSNKGYTIDNCVLCCQAINYMKRDLTEDQFISACKMIVQHRTGKLVLSNTHDPKGSVLVIQ